MVDKDKRCAVTHEGGGSELAKKSYESPNLQTFGKLNRMTQGSFSVGNDGAFGMTMNPGNGGMGMGMGMGGGMGMGMGMGMM